MIVKDFIKLVNGFLNETVKIWPSSDYLYSEEVVLQLLVEEAYNIDNTLSLIKSINQRFKSLIKGNYLMK